MKRLLSLVLIASLTSSVAKASSPRLAADLTLKLTLPWAKGLPLPMRGPVEGSVILSEATAAEISRHLEWGEKLPALCQLSMEDLAADKDRFIAEAEAKRKYAEDHQGVPTWALPAGIIGGILLGIVIAIEVRK